MNYICTLLQGYFDTVGYSTSWEVRYTFPKSTTLYRLLHKRKIRINTKRQQVQGNLEALILRGGTSYMRSAVYDYDYKSKVHYSHVQQIYVIVLYERLLSVYTY